MRTRDQSRTPAGDAVVPKAAIGRLSLYLRQLDRHLKEGDKTVSSRRLGQALGISDAQVRKDLGYFGQFGQAGIGYQVEGLTEAVRRILGTDREWPVALVGLGNLGRALVGYRGFRRQGFPIQAIFDVDPQKIGQTIEGICVEPADQIQRRNAELGIVLGIIAVPAEAAQAVADSLVASGVKGIMNFAPAPLSVPKCVSLISVDLAIRLESLSYQVQSGKSERWKAEGGGRNQNGEG